MATNIQSISQSLIASEETQEHTYLYGPVPPGTHSSLERLGKYLGIGTANAVREWLNSPQFKPIYETLYNSAILLRKKHRPDLQGPKLTAVQIAICDGEMYGDEKYSAHDLDTSNFEDIDHYALCLYRLRQKSKMSRNGIFRDKQMTDSQIETRLWQAMLRGGMDRSKAKASKQRTQEVIEFQAPPTILSDSRQQVTTPQKIGVQVQSSNLSNPTADIPATISPPASSIVISLAGSSAFTGPSQRPTNTQSGKAFLQVISTESFVLHEGFLI